MHGAIHLQGSVRGKKEKADRRSRGKTIFKSSVRAAENNSRWKGIVAKSSVLQCYGIDWKYHRIKACAIQNRLSPRKWY